MQNTIIFDDASSPPPVVNREAPKAGHRIYLFSSELDFICREISAHPERETGGDLYGLMLRSGDIVIFLATGPGPQADASITHFRQDQQFYYTTTLNLFEQFLVQHVGTWHSHHTLGFNFPSAGDVHSAQEMIKLSASWTKAAILISKHTLEISDSKPLIKKINLRSHLFYTDQRYYASHIGHIPGASGIRREVNTRYNSVGEDVLVPPLYLPDAGHALQLVPNYRPAQLRSRFGLLYECLRQSDLVPQAIDESTLVYIFEGVLQQIAIWRDDYLYGSLYGLLTHRGSAVVLRASPSTESAETVRNLYEQKGLELLGQWYANVPLQPVSATLDHLSMISESGGKLIALVASQAADTVTVRAASLAGEDHAPTECFIVVLPDPDYRKSAQPSPRVNVTMAHPLALDDLRGKANSAPVEIDGQTQSTLERATPYIQHLTEAGIGFDMRLLADQTIVVIIPVAEGQLCLYLRPDFIEQGPQIEFINIEGRISPISLTDLLPGWNYNLAAIVRAFDRSHTSQLGPDSITILSSDD